MREEQIRTAARVATGYSIREVGREGPLRNLEWKREFRLGCRLGFAPDARVGAMLAASFGMTG